MKAFSSRKWLDSPGPALATETLAQAPSVIATPSLPIHIKGISKRYGDTLVLDPFDLEVKAGELVSLLGPSGCGKTTTLRIIAGFVSPTSGTVRLGAADVTRVPPNRRGLGMVFQAYSLFPHMTVAENVGFGLRMQRMRSADRMPRVREMLRTVKLEAFEGRYPSQLSGGQQQRVALARALVTKPSVLLLDEPLGALDKNLRERMQFEIRELQQRLGITTVLVTHDQEEALTMSDRIAVMSHGKLIQAGTPHEVYWSPRTRFVSEFIGSSNLLAARVERRLPGDRLAVRLEMDGSVIEVRCHPEHVATPGDTVTLMIRPEKINLAPPAEGARLAKVQKRVFRGSYSIYELQMPRRDAPLLAFASDDNADWIVDGAVRVDWRDEDVFVLGEE